MTNWWNNLSIRYKIIFPVVLVTLLINIVAYYFFSNMIESHEIDSAIERSRTLILQSESMREFTAEQLKSGVFRGDLKTKDEILYTVPIFAAMKSASAKAGQLGMTFRVPKNFARNEKNNPDNYEKKVLEKLETGTVAEYFEIDQETDQLRYFRPIKLTEECLKCHGDPNKSMEYWGNKDGKDITGAKMENWKVGEVHGAFEVLMPMKPIRAEIAQSSRVIALITLFTIAFIALVTFIGSNSMIKKFRKIVTVTEKMSSGDLTSELTEDSTDEIGVLTKSVGSFTKNIRDIITKLKMQSNQISQSSDEIYNIANRLTVNSKDASNQASMVASATEEVSITINTMAATSEQMSVNASNVASSSEMVSVNANSIAGAIEEMSGSISGVADNAKRASSIASKASDMAGNATNTMEALGKAANEIGKVTDLIKRVAEQTNLLALNARIEAASAGEAGKGFAVVANEIKELANQSSAAAEDINAKISGVQLSADQAIKVIEEISSIINTINSSVHEISMAVEQQSEATADVSSNIVTTQMNINSIASNIAEIAGGSTDLAKSTSEAAKAVQDVAKSIHIVSQSANENTEGAESLHNAARVSAEVAQHLNELVSKFKV